MPEHAIVMGGSVAGLCAAAALADRFEKVTLLERDPEPTEVRPRKGTPQSWHAHLLLTSGQKALDDLCPGLLASLDERGAVGADAGKNFRWYMSGEWRPVFESGRHVRLQTRSLLETCLREKVAAKNVELRFGAKVDAPIHRDGQVVGVRLEDGSELESELVVDTMGRGTKTPTWLEEWGYRRPPRQAVRVDLAYCSGLFEVREGLFPGVSAFLIGAQPPRLKRGAAAFKVEDGRWMITLFGYHGDHAPLEFEDFCEWAKTAACEEVHHLLDGATLHGKLRRFKYPQQLRSRYDKLRSFPGRYLVLGDAVCSFDPVFGQGMSVAAREAMILGELIDKQGVGVRHRSFQNAIARVIDDPWQMATTEAYNWPETTGWKPAGAKLLQRFTARLHEKAAEDPELYDAFLDVVHLNERPASLFKPRVLRRVMFGARAVPAKSLPPASETAVEPEPGA